MTTQHKFSEPGGVPPRLALFQMLTGHYLSRAIYVAAKLGIADLLDTGPRHYGDLAKATGTHPRSLNRLMRLLSSAGVLAETENGCFALTPIGECLRGGTAGSSRAVALLFAGPLMQGWNELLYSVQTGERAFDHVFGMDAFAYMAQHPQEAAAFNEAMTAISAQVSASVASAYDFSQFRTIVDVGGGYGALLAAILKTNPSLRGVLFELPHVGEGAKKQIEAAGLASRCEVVAGDFFEDVPGGGDAYLLKSVIHDWDDARSVTILKNCRGVMAPQGKLLLVEVVSPPRMEPSAVNFIIAGSDVNMLVNAGGRERTEEEYRALFDAAGFKLARIIPTQGSLASLLEGTRM